MESTSLLVALVGRIAADQADSGGTVISLLGAFGIGSVLVAVIAAFAGRKLTRADTGARIVESAGDQIERLEREVERERRRADQEHARANREARQVRDWYARADEHDIWDRERMLAARDRGEELRPRPSLYPPPKKEDE